MKGLVRGPSGGRCKECFNKTGGRSLAEIIPRWADSVGVKGQGTEVRGSHPKDGDVAH